MPCRMSRPRRPLAALAALGLALGLSGGVAATASAAPAAADDGPVVGMPDLLDSVPAWLAAWTDPDYWASYVHDAMMNQQINVPYPADPVKPEAVLPNVMVADGRYVSSLPAKPIDLSGVTYDFGGQTKTIEQFVRTTRTDQLVFVHDGTVVGEFYAGGFDAETRHQAWSVTKTFVAAAVGVAKSEGLIGSLKHPIDRYLPELAGTEWEGVTIRDILQMESGVHWDEGTPVLVINTQVEQWRDVGLDLFSGGALGKTRNEFLATLPSMGYEPGTEFHYNSGNTQVLAWLTERLYGKPFQEILSAKIWKPMGAEGDAVLTTDRVGDVIASHGLFARPHDFARFGELLRNGGRTADGRRVLPKRWVRAMTTMTKVSDGQYGLQTWAHAMAAPDAYTAGGFQGQKITVLPRDCLTAVRTAHSLTIDASGGFGMTFYDDEWQVMLRAVADELGACR